MDISTTGAGTACLNVHIQLIANGTHMLTLITGESIKLAFDK